MKNNQRCSISQSAAERQEYLSGRPHGGSEEAESDGYHRHAESDNGYETNAETTGKEFSRNTEQGGMRDESHHHDDYGEKQQFCQYDAQRESLAVSPWLRFGDRAYHAALPECAISHGCNDDPRQWSRCHVAGECSEKPPDAFIAEQRAHGGCWRGSRNEPRHQEQCHLQQPRWHIPSSISYSSSACKLSISMIRSSQALTTRRVAFTPYPPLPLGNSFCTSSFCLFSKLFTPKGIPRRLVICSLV